VRALLPMLAPSLIAVAVAVALAVLLLCYLLLVCIAHAPAAAGGHSNASRGSTPPLAPRGLQPSESQRLSIHGCRGHK
jgi:hypothetical protein